MGHNHQFNQRPSQVSMAPPNPHRLAGTEHYNYLVNEAQQLRNINASNSREIEALKQANQALRDRLDKAEKERDEALAQCEALKTMLDEFKNKRVIGPATVPASTSTSAPANAAGSLSGGDLEAVEGLLALSGDGNKPSDLE